LRRNPTTGLVEDTVPFDEIAERISAFHGERWGSWFRFVPYHPLEVISYTARPDGRNQKIVAVFLERVRFDRRVW
jgi:hypothetical protein